LSHSLPFLAALSPLLAWAARRWALSGRAWWRAGRGGLGGSSFSAWWALAAAALLTHPLLDLFTSYGTQILWPFSDRRYAVDAVAIVDPLVTLPLLAALFLAWRRHGDRVAAGVSWAALALASGYIGLGYLHSIEARAEARERLHSRGVAVAELRAVPTLFNTWLWRVMARDGKGGLYLGHVSLLEAGRGSFVGLHNSGGALAEAALASREGRLFERFAMGWVSTRLETDDDGVASVHLDDQRYGLISRPEVTIFSAEARFDREGRLLEVIDPMSYPPIDGLAELRELGRLLGG